MEEVRYAQGETYRPQYQEGFGGNATGIDFSIMRCADGYWWDFTASAFQDAYDADSLKAMTEDDAGTNGTWNYETGWATPDANAQYRVRFKVTDASGSFYVLGPKIIVNSSMLDVLADWVDGGRLDLLLDAIKVITDALTAVAAANLAKSAGTIVSGTVSHDNTVATTTVFYSDDITEATTDHYKGRIVIFTSGALQNQATDITGYELSAGEGKFTVTALTEAPGDNVTFIII